MSTRIYFLYEEVGYAHILDRYYCPNGTREKTLTFANYIKDLDVNCSRCLSVYKNEIDDYGKFDSANRQGKNANFYKIGGHPRVVNFQDTLPVVSQDLIAYMKEDFRSNVINIPKKKSVKSVDNKWYRMFSDTNTEFKAIETFDYVFRRF